MIRLIKQKYLRKFFFKNSKIFSDNRKSIDSYMNNIIKNKSTKNFTNNETTSTKSLSSSLALKCKLETSNNNTQMCNLKILPYIEAMPTMYAWAPLQKNILVIKDFSLILLFY